MPKESFMLVSLKEDKAKKLAHVMANPSCIKILEYLAGKDATETQVAKDLKIPLSTVHYNLQQLVDAKLVLAEEFHYSEKGREVNHYKLANKYIIIAPQEDNPNFLSHLKKYIPVTIITLGLAAVIKTLQFFTAEPVGEAAPTLMAKSAPAADAGLRTFAATGPALEQAPVPWWQSPLIDYFIAGAIFVLLVMIVVEAIYYWRRKREE